MSEEKHTCEERSKGSMFRRSACGRSASFNERDWSGELKWFCGTHAPSERKKRQIARDLKAKPARDAQAARWRLNAAAPDYHKAALAMIERHDADARSANFQKCGCDNCKPFRPIVEKAEGRQ